VTPRLEVSLGPLRLRNPVMTASGTCGSGLELAPWADLSRLGAVVGKTVTTEPRAGNTPPRTFETASGMLNSIGLQNPGIAKFVAEKTGAHLLVLRSEGADADEGGSYALKVKVKAAKTNRSFTGTVTNGVLPFPAARGGTVSGKLTGNVIPPVLLASPGGLPTFQNFTTKGSVHTLAPAFLDGATGGWELRFAQVGPVDYQIKVKPAKRLSAFEGIDTAGP